MKKTLTILLVLVFISVGTGAYFLFFTQKTETVSKTEITNTIKNKIEGISRMETSSPDLTQTYTNYTQKGAAAEEFLKEPSLNKEDKAYLLLTQASGLLDGSKNSLDTDRKNKTLESYRILYSITQDIEMHPSYRGTAFLALKQAAYLSGSEEWFLEAVQKYDPETYAQVEKLSPLEKKVLFVKIEYGKKATSLVLSPFNEIELASDLLEMALLEEDISKKKSLTQLSENVYTNWSLRKEQVSGYYDGRPLALSRSAEYKTRYLVSLISLHGKEDDKKNLENYISQALPLLESQTIEENSNRSRFVSAAFIRVFYASHLYNTYGKTKVEEISIILKPLYSEQKENIPGFLFYLKTHENKTSFTALKKIASLDTNFKKFLQEIGWTI